jgi:hypothetical protein
VLALCYKLYAGRAAGPTGVLGWAKAVALATLAAFMLGVALHLALGVRTRLTEQLRALLALPSVRA